MQLPPEVLSESPSARLMHLLLSSRDEYVTTHEIAESTGVSKHTIREVLKHFEQKGLIETRRQPDNPLKKEYRVIGADSE